MPPSSSGLSSQEEELPPAGRSPGLQPSRTQVPAQVESPHSPKKEAHGSISQGRKLGLGGFSTAVGEGAGTQTRSKCGNLGSRPWALLPGEEVDRQQGVDHGGSAGGPAGSRCVLPGPGGSQAGRRPGVEPLAALPPFVPALLSPDPGSISESDFTGLQTLLCRLQSPFLCDYNFFLSFFLFSSLLESRNLLTGKSVLEHREVYFLFHAKAITGLSGPGPTHVRTHTVQLPSPHPGKVCPAVRLEPARPGVMQTRPPGKRIL